VTLQRRRKPLEQHDGRTGRSSVHGRMTTIQTSPLLLGPQVYLHRVTSKTRTG
jgi:hypothetical protein